MVILLDKRKNPLGFITEKRLRKLCEKKRAVVYRKYPTVAVLMDTDVRDLKTVLSYRIKIDPGAKHTGISIVCNEKHEVVFYMQIEHRGEAVKAGLNTRKGARRNRRQRETWYRYNKFRHGGDFTTPREDGWLVPSVKSTADNIINWIRRLSRWINITKCSLEAVRFDAQLLDNPVIEGVQYQQGELFGYELKEYLLDKYGHTCQYCGGLSGDKVLEWEHIRPRSRGGSDSVKNATLSCSACNRAKGNRTPEEWFEVIRKKPVLTDLDKARLTGIEKVKDRKIQKSNRYCAWVTASRRYTERNMFQMFGTVECSSGGRTKYNREKILHLPKDHHYDALCVGTVPEGGYHDRTHGYVLMVKAKGRGTRLLGNINSCGIIITKFREHGKMYKGFMTGDIVAADIPRGKHHGHYEGRVMIRRRDTFVLKPFGEKKFDVNVKYLKRIQSADGYEYLYVRRKAI